MPRFVPAAEAREVLSGTCKVVHVEGHEIALFNIDGVFAAVANRCPHLGGPLGEGILRKGVVTCPWHGWPFDPRTGRSPLIPEAEVPTYPVKVRNGTLYVGLEGGDEGA